VTSLAWLWVVYILEVAGQMAVLPFMWRHDPQVGTAVSVNPTGTALLAAVVIVAWPAAMLYRLAELAVHLIRGKQ